MPSHRSSIIKLYHRVIAHILITSGQQQNESEQRTGGELKEPTGEIKERGAQEERGRDEDNRSEVRLVFAMNATKILQEL